MPPQGGAVHRSAHALIASRGTRHPRRTGSPWAHPAAGRYINSMLARLTSAGDLAVEERHAGLHAAIDRAAKRLGRGVALATAAVSPQRCG